MAMEYFSGVSDALRLTFVQVMIMANLSIGIFIIGMYINIRKWGSISRWGIGAMYCSTT